jgi:arylsulfatase A-like enzyme
MRDRPNIILVISDTLRTAYLGCYGNERVRTPHIDAFAASGTRFTNAYPEALPTIPVRRTMHTGRRVFPFRDYRPVPWDIVYLPGWQPMDPGEDTLAENLAGSGYHTGFVTDTLPYFAPGFNFTRGFQQWEFVRGQQQDRWKSGFTVSPEAWSRYAHTLKAGESPDHLVRMHLANTAHVKSEEDTSTARVFRWACDFLEDNTPGQPFYLLVDCFDPHEPWEAPEAYYKEYGDPDFDEKKIIHSHYGPAEEFGYSLAQIEDVKAHYSGLVSLVDAWFGQLMAKLDALGLSENTAVFFMGDHGTNFCENPRNVIGKPHHAMYPGVMHLPLIARLPAASKGAVSDELVYDLDVTASIYDLARVASKDGIEGKSLLPLLDGAGEWQPRDYVTCGYNWSLSCIDRESWVLTNIDGDHQEAFDRVADPGCQAPLPDAEARPLFERAWERLCADAGGPFPDYRERSQTDAIGQRPSSGRG